MPNCAKLYRAVKDAPASSRLEDVWALAECAGFLFARQTGTSHRFYKAPGQMQPMNFQAGADGKAKSYQVRQLLKFIEERDITFTDRRER